MRRVCALFVYLGIVLLLGFAASGKEVTLKEALEVALVKNPDIKKAELSLAVAKSALSEAREDTFSPTISLRETAGLFGVPGGFSLELKDTISFDASLWEEAQVNLEKSKRSLEATREEVKKKVIAAYLDVLRAEGELALAEKTAELYREKVQSLLEGYEKGEVGSSALKEAQGRYKEAEANLKALEAQLRLRKQEFFALLGEEMEEDVTFAPLPEFSLSLPEETSLSSFVALNDTVEDLEGQKRVLEASLSRLRREGRPQILLEGMYTRDGWSLSLGYNFSQESLDVALEKPLALSGSSSGDFSAGLAISWTFSPSLSEKKKQAELERESLLLDLEVAKRNTLFDLQEKYLAVLRAKEILESKKMLLEAQREIFEARKKQFDLGVLDGTTLLESELGFLSAQNDYDSARYELLESFLEFLRGIEEPILWETLFPSQGGENG
ncbi:MAG: TolC family protein [Candidatus Caldatribacterium sp.]|nr:TolC family protein [Candidatus Caldatribacterium sp.]